MKRFLVVMGLVGLFLSGCVSMVPVLNPIIGTWENSVVGVDLTTYVFNSDGTRTQTTTVFGIGTTVSGTWKADSSILTRSKPGSPDITDYYSFNSDKSLMTLSPTAGGVSFTLSRK